MIIQQYRDFPTSPMRSVWPAASFGFYQDTLGAGEAVHICHGVMGAAATFPTSNVWDISSRPIFSWYINAVQAGHPGCVLHIDISYDGQNFDNWTAYPILEGALPNIAQGVFIPGVAADFQILNPSGVLDIDIDCLLKQQGLE